MLIVAFSKDCRKETPKLKKQKKNIQIHIKFSGEPDPEEFEREVTSLQNLQQQPAPSWNPYGGAQGNKTRLKRHSVPKAVQ